MAAILLSRYLLCAARQRDGNCLTFVADWLALVVGHDSAAQWRFVKTKWQVAAALRAGGGELGLLDAAMQDLGIARAAKERAGDIALVLLPTSARRQRPCGAICIDAATFAVRTRDLGVLLAAAPAVVGVWNVSAWLRRSAH